MFLFLGAGAHRQFNIPLMPELSDEIEQEFPRYSAEIRTIKEELDRLKFSTDIEAVLTVIIGWADPKKALKGAGPFISQVLDHIPSQRSGYENFIDEVEWYIGDRCFVTERKTIEKIAKFYSDFFHRLSKIFSGRFTLPGAGKEGFRYPALDIFTTNYDTVLESYCTEIDAPYYYGYEPTRSGSAIRKFDLIGYNKADILRIYKLHGTVNLLKLESGRIVEIQGPLSRGDRMYGEEAISHIMIFPVWEKYVSHDPYFSFFKMLKGKLIAHDECIAIGYSFRDEAINSAFSDDFRGSRKKLFIIDKKASDISERLKKTFECHVIPIPKKFEDPAIFDELARTKG